MQNLMEDKRLDLAVPLLSVRRHSAPPEVPLPAPSWRSAAPFYKSDLKSGPVRNPGVVPFVWEQKPGQPKPGAPPRNRLPPVPLLPPGWVRNTEESDRHFGNPNSILEDKPMGDAVVVASAELLKVKEGEDDFSDAVETLSRTESFFMNCSVSGLSGIPDAVVPYGGFSSDPQSRDLMMDRFLPAAKAMATGSKQCSERKLVKVVERVEHGEHRRVPLPYQHRPNFVARYPHDEIDSSDGDEEEDDYEGSEHFMAKACGLLPRICMKSSFCLLNPMLGMKVGGRRSRIRSSTGWKNNSVMPNNGLLSQAENELWEAVYNHKLKLGVPLEGEGGSQSISKTNQHLQWRDSQKLDGSSCCHSGGSQEAFEVLKRNEKDGKIDGIESLDKDGEKYSSMSSSLGSQQRSGILSPRMVNHDLLDSGLMVGVPHSKHSSTDSEKYFRFINGTSKPASVVSEVIMDNQRVEENLGLERHNGFVLQPQSSELHKSEKSAPEMVDQQNTVKLLNCSDGSLLLNADGQPLIESKFRYLIPPPLPKTPSESWLSRTLPSVSTKIPSGQSSLGIHMLQRKHGLYPYSTSPRQESDAKPSESQHTLIPCLAAKQEIPCKPSMRYQCQIPPTEHSGESNIKRSEPRNDQKLDLKPSKPPRRQIRFADVLMMPLSPRSEM